MKKLAIIALAALTLAPSAASAGPSWHDVTCFLFNVNCHRSDRHDIPWWEIPV